MNKKILAVAVSAAMFAAASVAVAGEAEVYGLIHMSLDSMSGAGDCAGGAAAGSGVCGATATKAVSATDDDSLFVSSNSSRLGVKGAEDLGNGMKAIFQYEMSVPVSNGTALSMDRNSFAGLSGGFGKVIVGRHDMPFKTAVRKFDLFGDTIGDNRALTRLKMGGDDWAMRRSDLIMYSNKVGAVAFDIAYAVEDGTEDASDMGARVTFANGPLTVMGAYETHGTGNLTGLDLSGDGDTADAGESGDDSTGWILAASYGLGDITLAAGYVSVGSIAGADLDVTGWTAAAAYKAGSSTFKVQHTAAEVSDNGGEGAVTALGVDYALSKATKLYAVYATGDNGDGLVASLAAGGAHDSTITRADNKDGTNEDPTGISVGLIHKF
jgi:predicted porin